MSQIEQPAQQIITYLHSVVQKHSSTYPQIREVAERAIQSILKGSILSHEELDFILYPLASFNEKEMSLATDKSAIDQGVLMKYQGTPRTHGPPPCSII
ncbi:hypothetical protein SISNIDRAFT_550719 [Sistotremastrum niveocremeum HHB9708]|uniref:Uncharacterized protein n=1 Tax=Sistotremastrum niveocremeum HHB9708 TaxID=1314777 RepID=A0A164SZR2_9AGAM|nr:hypothetical protein SISNIDRAFT_550719 [Sistotremastrum niveocremeum HHB9708]